MKRLVASILLTGCAIGACKKHEDATVHAEPVVTATETATASAAPVAAVDSAGVTSPTPSASASAAVDPKLARLEALRQAQSVGMIGLLNAGAGGDPNAPTAPWGHDDSLGNDPLSARGNMWGDDIGDASVGGLGMRGSGPGGGGRGEGIGLGNLGTIGHGSGTGSAHTPRVRQGATTVNGRLPPEVIQRIVRQNFGRFRVCYQQGLAKDPKLAGTVATKFVISTTGSVTSVTRDPSTTLPDASVVSCITGSFSSLSFPQPEGGIVVVTYPINFAPGD
jgi:hypothetical protein